MPKLLLHFLREKQEPFSLDVYLLERGYSLEAKRVDAKSTRRFSKRRCSKVFKAVLGRLAFRNDRRIEISEDEEEEEDVVSSASGTTMYNSCSESDVENAHFPEDFKWRSLEDTNNNKQLSPISVLEETYQTDEGQSPLHQKECNSKTRQEFEEYSQYIMNKRAMQQSKKLLVDCVRLMIENEQRKDENGEQLKKMLGRDELWKLVCENVWAWSQDSIDKTNIPQLLHSDFMASEKEWTSAFEKQRNETCVEIGDAILEAIINEIVTS